MHAKTSIVAALLSLSLLGACEQTQTGGNRLGLGDIETQADAAESAGDTQTAITLWEEYVERRPQRALARYNLGRLLLVENHPVQATDHLWVAHDLRPGNIEYLETLAEALFQANERENAFSLLQETIEEGGLAEGHLRMARFAQRAGLIDEAQESLAIAAAIDGQESDRAHRALARLARQTGDEEAESHAWRTVLWFDIADPEANARLTQLGEIPGPSIVIEPRSAN